MSQNKQEIFKLLLDLHKALLENQKAQYEKTHGTIGDANKYFQLVVSHEDFSWLRQLSAKITVFDEILESDEQDITAIAQEIVLLLSSETDNKFYEKLKTMTVDNNVTEMTAKILEALKNPA